MFVFFFWLRGMWSLGSPTREGTHTVCIGRPSLNQGTTREVLIFDIDFYIVEQGETCYTIICSLFCYKYTQNVRIFCLPLTEVVRSFKRLPLCASLYPLSQCPRDHINQSRPPGTPGVLSGGNFRLQASLLGPSLCPCSHSPETPSCERLTPIAMFSHEPRGCRGKPERLVPEAVRKGARHRERR